MGICGLLGACEIWTWLSALCMLLAPTHIQWPNAEVMLECAGYALG